ncbi:cob(I)yrinic acid a,c-diamide adenosyltransferase [Candidatus Marsarchaeota G2 archaeon ECH_B_SAG-F08]|jgi:cob(I)alamin adenosyltransferase|uniref:Cob(I)yrinic acid a,c-diamide adenosyltransferase n=3 Tax=Candidatus Marsarchaeota TaxID=1978152 RepID=A0A2R6AF88_9ARCH|nr:MAG: cob(I)yrinic acid a,c-diamide adenosyltransferase [Candidatus Marsarchaeota G1 archaeon OSP_D]PSN85047.1 MAG: cob(I)yrinic acid a,c-diamide adenosyltransferase [Candidatus Marsarchaeota G1 archaeon BE_D]PSN97695.1 MAG: cob(I)yrinic acid a,c-diamide adenosyltransferase [Candidatus Marsarchaeota G2 archaeon ECH_B_SAG-F08]
MDGQSNQRSYINLSSLLCVIEREKRGWVIVYTGDGKGKSTAAFGMAIRAVGHGWKVAILQFVKGSWPTGEEKAFAHLSERVLFKKLGIGFVTWNPKRPYEEHLEAAKRAWEEAKNVVSSNVYRLVILDEINNATRFGLIPVEEVLSLIDTKPKEVNLVLTGRGADERIIQKADLVTEMKNVKHPFDKGEWARVGIDY